MRCWYISYQSSSRFGRHVELVDAVVRGDWSLWFASRKRKAREKSETMILISAVEISEEAADVIVNTTTYGVFMRGELTSDEQEGQTP